jgi:hypothetical protein
MPGPRSIEKHSGVSFEQENADNRPSRCHRGRRDAISLTSQSSLANVGAMMSEFDEIEPHQWTGCRTISKNPACVTHGDRLIPLHRLYPPEKWDPALAVLGVVMLSEYTSTTLPRASPSTRVGRDTATIRLARDNGLTYKMQAHFQVSEGHDGGE